VRVLLDENLPHKLRAHLAHHETVTVAYLGWGGLKNGELLKAAQEAGFEVFVTGDRSLEHQQSMVGRQIAVITLSANNWPIIKHHVGTIVTAIETAAAGSFTRVECGTFVRPRRPNDRSLSREVSKQERHPSGMAFR
jgi:predicted nuclease of predicted toxin-antitoxin system